MSLARRLLYALAMKTMTANSQSQGTTTMTPRASRNTLSRLLMTTTVLIGLLGISTSQAGPADGIPALGDPGASARVEAPRSADRWVDRHAFVTWIETDSEVGR